jgi:hypothetical protein
MKHLLICVIVLAFLPSCGSNSDEKRAEDPSSTSIKAETSDTDDMVLNPQELIIGDWQYNYDMDGSSIEFLLRFKNDGTYYQSIGGNPVDGTWEFVDDKHIVVKNPNIRDEDGQKWLLVKSTKEELHIDWNIKGGEAKILEFKRK